MKTGDKVSVLNDVIRGTVISVTGKQVAVETDDGFVLTFLKKELVVHHSDLDRDTTTIKKGPKLKPMNKNAKDNSVIDLHLTNKNIPKTSVLPHQLTLFKKALNQAIGSHKSEITFIHGVGEGVLKNAIEKILKQHKIPYAEAPYTDFGTDAAMTIFIKGVKKPII